jgi:hypothetical protein
VFKVPATPPRAPDPAVLTVAVGRLVVVSPGLFIAAVKLTVSSIGLLTRTDVRSLEFALSAALADTLTMFSCFTLQSSLGSHWLMIVSYLHPFLHQEGVSESMSRQFRR